MADVAVLPEPLEEVAPPKGRHGSVAWILWIARRLGLAVLTLWLVSVLVFIATTALGDPIRAILGKDYNADKARVAQLTEQLNLNESAVKRYLDWLGGLLHGDLGTSIANQRPVGQLISSNVLNSFVLVLISAVVLIPVAFGIAMISANYRRKRPDTVIQTILLALAGLPEFVTGILLVALFSTTVFHWLPAVTIAGAGHPWDQPSVMVLPVATLVLAVAPYVSRIVRSTLLEVLDSDYVELARLKGIPEKVVLRKHALLNAVVPGIQVVSLQLAWLAGGVVFVETVFNYPGIGALLVDSVRNHDIPVVQALSMIIAGVYVVVNLIADLLSILLTPRSRTAISS
ncbi:ABC-type dipeptide/oligopeptide/nickel transport system, permease component [Nostocoides japonicum T1-X7]|uniref:ABC-type dipeptide/oligopeptide/nickel transport system, permease component n=1 Tax=Nostocoides japonicum T1-X7 TaxID=1194083 RepID=A0A077M1S5_9MICO|nr:ABC transporter permease [Tetrasphaera japonica]CCH79027.1 ABC-type dipeptide/oligopeptide/nickel transport system, permease component [Tetrasphaera japonica T1-X7]